MKNPKTKGMELSELNELNIGFAASAFNEAENIEELHNRCKAAVQRLRGKNNRKINYRLYIANNGSVDDTDKILKRLVRVDSDIYMIENKRNYGPEPSAANALNLARKNDLIVLLCSDLQDPPEVAEAMIQMMIDKYGTIDGILGLKRSKRENIAMRTARKAYYKSLKYATRLKSVPPGFHGFGCYKGEAIREALKYWDKTELNLRQCLVNGCVTSEYLQYEQASRQRGASSYKALSYVEEAIRAILNGDAAASRIAFITGSLTLGISFILMLIIIKNYVGGMSGYAGGVTTVIAIMLVSLSIQTTMMGILSRQIEGL